MAPLASSSPSTSTAATAQPAQRASFGLALVVASLWVSPRYSGTSADGAALKWGAPPPTVQILQSDPLAAPAAPAHAAGRVGRASGVQPDRAVLARTDVGALRARPPHWDTLVPDAQPAPLDRFSKPVLRAAFGQTREAQPKAAPAVSPAGPEAVASWPAGARVGLVPWSRRVAYVTLACLWMHPTTQPSRRQPARAGAPAGVCPRRRAPVLAPTKKHTLWLRRSLIFYSIFFDTHTSLEKTVATRGAVIIVQKKKDA